MAPKKISPKPANKAATKKPTKTDRIQRQQTSGIKAECRRRQQFVKEYLIDLNGRRAAIRAGYAESNARDTAHVLLRIPEIAEAVEAGMVSRAKRTEITADKVLERLWAVATADSSELIEMQWRCCRYCHGLNHRYQWTPRELQEAITDFNRAKIDAESKGLKYSVEFDQAGGLGFDPRRDPASDCPECFGEGQKVVLPKDTRDMSPEAKLLYAGVKTTQHGLEIKSHDQMAALRDVGKHLGMFVEKVQSEVRITSVAGILEELDGADTGIGAASSRRTEKETR